MQGIHSKQSMDRHRLRTVITESILMTTARVCMFPRSLMHECIMALTHNGSFISDFMTTARTTAKATVDDHRSHPS